MSNILYRLAEDHLHYGLEGKIVPRELIKYYDLALFDAVSEQDYINQVTIKGETDEHDGVYLFDSAHDVEKIFQKITGINSEYKKFILAQFFEGKPTYVNTPKGSFTFTVTEKIF